MPRVSAVIPNYNHARFLPQRIESVLSQTFGDIEVIMLDDASTDDSRDVISRYLDDPRVRLIANKHNSGSTFRQWNKGMRDARGEYIWIAESDDYADPRLLETLVARLDESPQVGLAYCQSVMVDEHGTVGEVVELTDPDMLELSGERWARDFIADGRQECSDYLLLRNTIANASATVFRRSIAEQVGFADESFGIGGDWLFWAEILLRSNVAYVAQPLNYFRQHGGTVRARRTIDGTSIEESYRIASRICSSLDISESVLEPIRESYCASWLWSARKHKVSLSRHRRIWRTAREFDPALVRRCARLVMHGLIGRLTGKMKRCVDRVE